MGVIIIFNVFGFSSFFFRQFALLLGWSGLLDRMAWGRGLLVNVQMRYY